MAKQILVKHFDKFHVRPVSILQCVYKYIYLYKCVFESVNYKVNIY